MKHTSHPDIIDRLRRAEGHWKSVLTMFEAGRPWLDLAQQLHAVEAAISNAKRQLIHDHIDHCPDEDPAADPQATITALKSLTKYL